MVYLIFQILWFLVAAAAIGFAAGWLCRSAAMLGRREAAALQARAAQSELEAQREQLEARLAEAVAAKEALQEDLAQTRHAAETEGRTRRKLEREHGAALVKLEARERDVARLSERETEGETAPLPAAKGAPKSPGGAPVSGSFVRQK